MSGENSTSLTKKQMLDQNDMKLDVYSIFHLDFKEHWKLNAFLILLNRSYLYFAFCEFICCCIYCVLPFIIPLHAFSLAQPVFVLCELTGIVPIHLTGWCRVKFWKMSWHKNARQCYHRKLLLWNRCLFKEMNASESVNSDYTFMHMYALYSIYYTTLFCALPCAQLSLSVKTTSCFHWILWKPRGLARDPWQCQERHPSFTQGSQWRAVKPW